MHQICDNIHHRQDGVRLHLTSIFLDSVHDCVGICVLLVKKLL